jgi:hypothetical protein
MEATPTPRPVSGIAFVHQVPVKLVPALRGEDGNKRRCTRSIKISTVPTSAENLPRATPCVVRRSDPVHGAQLRELEDGASDKIADVIWSESTGGHSADEGSPLKRRRVFRGVHRCCNTTALDTARADCDNDLDAEMVEHLPPTSDHQHHEPADLPQASDPPAASGATAPSSDRPISLKDAALAMGWDSERFDKVLEKMTESAQGSQKNRAPFEPVKCCSVRVPWRVSL